MTAESVPQPLTDRGRRTRESLLQAARDMFEGRGFAGTRISDIAAAAGTSHGTVYTYFPAKDDLLMAVVAGLRAELGQEPIGQEPVGQDPTGQEPTGQEPVGGDAIGLDPGAGQGSQDPFPRLLAANTRFLRRYAEHARMLSVIEEAASADPRWHGELEAIRQGYIKRTVRALTRWRRAGAVAVPGDLELTAAALTGMVETFARRVVARLPDADASGSGSSSEPGSAARPAPAPSDGDAALLITTLWAQAVGMHVPPPSSLVGRPTSDPSGRSA